MAAGEGSTGELLARILRDTAAEVASTESAVFAAEPDAVHQQRVRVRRLRSVLAGFRDELDARAADRVRVAYAEWGRELGIVRDQDVIAEVAESLLERAGIDDPEVARRLVDDRRAASAAAHPRLVELGHGPRGVARERMLAAFVDDPGVADPASEAGAVVASVLRRQAQRVKKAARRVDGTLEAYHALRKAARRLQYVADAIARAAPDLKPSKIGALAAAGDDLREALGAHRDGILFADLVEHEGALAARAGESFRPYEDLAALARKDAAAQLETVPRALGRLRAAASRLN